MASDREAATAELPRSAPQATSGGGVGGPARHDCQSRLDKIEYLISLYRMRYMHYVWQAHLNEAGEMARKVDRLLERWQRVRDRDAGLLADCVQRPGVDLVP